MKASDAIVRYLSRIGVTDAFGYPGGMVTHLMESLRSEPDLIRAHLCRNEQGAAFEACGYAQATGRLGLAYATSGPGATNLLTGVCHAWFDSVPTLFLTGQVNSSESSRKMRVRQRGFQETDVVTLVSSVTKGAWYVSRAAELPELFALACETALSGRPGPTLLDIPMDVMRAAVPDAADWPAPVIGPAGPEVARDDLQTISCLLEESRRPCVLLGAGACSTSSASLGRRLMEELNVPFVTSMAAVGTLPTSHPRNNGFVGAYGSRVANFVVAKCDLLLSLGSRLDIRQVGATREMFAPNARIIRVDVDDDELSYRVREDEIQIHADATSVMRALLSNPPDSPLWGEWAAVCERIRAELAGLDLTIGNEAVRAVGDTLPSDCVVASDVGQNQVWAAQSLRLNEGQRLITSASFGSMGYALPAAIGACVGTGRPSVCLTGDGGLQMNLQELALVAEERLPVKVVALNNGSLGMIRHFQDMYFGGRHMQTTAESGWSCPDLSRIAEAYGMRYERIRAGQRPDASKMLDGESILCEVQLPGDTVIEPKLRFGEPNQDQDPPLDRELFERLMSL